MKYMEHFGEFHHTGMAAREFEASISLLGSLGYELEHESFIDEHQGVLGQFMILGNHRVEVLADLPGHSTLVPWLKQGELVPYHFGYLVNNLDSAILDVQGVGMRLIREPRPAVAFHGRRIAFLASRSRLLIELIQK